MPFPFGEHEPFVKAIADDPANDHLRLVYADWLEERGDPLGEFIRLQIALEPLRRPCADLLAELERHKRLHRIPPGMDDSDDDWPLAWDLAREEKLLIAHKAVWLGDLPSPHEAGETSAEIRRGFANSIKVGMSELEKRLPEVRRLCPTFQQLIVLGTRGRGRELSECRSLQGLRDLLCAGWLTEADALALAQSPHLHDLQTLTLWVEPDAADALLPLTALPHLRELNLVQLWGGRFSDYSDELNRQTDELATMLRRERPHWSVTIERPFERRFPLDGSHVGYGIHAGHLPNGQAVLVTENLPTSIIYFDGDGHFFREAQLDLDNRIKKDPRYGWEDWEVKELLEVLNEKVGFTPGPIFVREFWADTADVGVSQCSHLGTDISNPMSIRREHCEEISQYIFWWWTTFQFVVRYDLWADGLGRVHSS